MRLGRGGQGEVFEAIDSLGLTWALKIGYALETDNQTALDRFAKEAVWVQEKLGRLPRDCGIFVGEHYGVHERRFYIKMRRLRGTSLADVLAERGALPLAEAIELALAIARAVTLAHTQNALHRDLKPENIFLENGTRVQVLDWGCIQLIEAARVATTSGGVTCTVGYASLEQFDLTGAPLTPATDVYSLGVVLYEVLTGGHPFLRWRRNAALPSGDSGASRFSATARMGPLPTLVNSMGNPLVDTRTAPTGLLHNLPRLALPDTHSNPVHLASTGGGESSVSEFHSHAPTLREVLHSQVTFNVRDALSEQTHLPSSVVALLGEMLVPNARQRVAKMSDVVQRLESCLADVQRLETAGHHQRHSGTFRWRKVFEARAVIVALVFAGAGLFVGFSVVGSRQPNEGNPSPSVEPAVEQPRLTEQPVPVVDETPTVIRTEATRSTAEAESAMAAPLLATTTVSPPGVASMPLSKRSRPPRSAPPVTSRRSYFGVQE